MRFEKWQALGNDYVIVEAGRAPLGADAGAGAAASATRISGSAPTGCCCSRAARTRSSSPSCGSSTPTAPRPSSRATARARRSSTCAATAGPTPTTFSILTAAGPITPTITSERTCSVEMGRASTQLEGLPVRRPPTARGTLDRRRPRLGLPARLDRQPAVRDRGRGRARGARPGGDRARDRSATSCSRTAPTSPSSRIDGSRVRARIFERGVGETLSSGTGASGAAVTAFLRGAAEPDHGRARRRRARGRGRRRPRRAPHRLGRAGLRRRALGRAARGARRPGLSRRANTHRFPRRWESPIRPSAWRRCPPYMFAELERRVAEKRAAGHRRDQPRDRRPRPADLPAHRRGDAGGGRRARQPEVPEQPRPRPSSARPSPTSTSERFGVEIDPETEVIPAIGAKECIYNLCFAFLDPGDVALASDPGYPVYTGGPILAGADAGAAAAASPSSASPPTSTRSPPRSRARARLMFLNYPNNPTGAVVPDGLLRARRRPSPASTRSSSSTTTPTRRRPTTATSRRASSRRPAPRRSGSRSSRSPRATT